MPKNRRNSSPNRLASRAGRGATKKAAPEASTLEKVLAIGAIVCIIVSVLAFLATLIIAATVDRQTLAAAGLKQIVWIAYVGLPVGFAMLLLLVFLNARNRKKQQR